MIPRRRRRLALIAVAAVVAGFLPSLLILATTWRKAMSDAAERMDRYASLLEHRVDDVFTAADTTLSELAVTVDRECSGETVDQLRRAVYNSLYFREAGLIVDERLVCTSVRRYESPVPVTNRDHLTWPARGVHIAAPDLTLEDQVSIIVLRSAGTTPLPGFAVNLLLNPRELMEPIRAAIDEQSIALRVERQDGAVLARAGSAAVIEDDDSLIRTLTARHYPVRIIVSGSRDELIEDWWDNAAMFVAFGLAMSLPLFLLLANLDRRERSMDAQLVDAIDNDELRVHYQPIHASDNLRAVGVEALLRWQHPGKGLVMPNVFVPLAEESGLIIPMTAWLMKKVRADLETLLREHPDFYVALNLSPKHFADPGLPALVREIFGGDFPAGRLVFEVTERELLSSSDDVARDAIEALRSYGARIALDDFGTGYSSLRYLAQYRFDLLKIDKAFVDAIGTESVTAGLVEDMVKMACRLSLATVAEGVETDFQMQRLREVGVDYLQGWRLSAALPLPELQRYLDRGRA
ncbi:EAL domain-containing protein [Nevskia sp.]|uniref:EAL domain-containing protein n=1 Tax=Nevskia sp. TaxID=1929292 RepID=UPI0025D5046A|nr:EAL domain-containing protein [Nevskia sp.]